jgi:small subunit ribosomal protein S12
MLLKNPQKKGIIKKIRIQTPRKPNSARRQVFKLLIFKNRYTVCSLKGKGHTLKKHLRVLICGKGSRDLPGIYCHAIRNKYDLKGISSKIRRRSIYGNKKS